ncbi:Protein of unknown function [Singulisphaera sp. GP187]|uniref:glycosyltransferase family 87 protein n=1 Tax=Singulisphaera sp. GP187 TaxID=1882752 RepID=UPI00092B08A4|nr:glycosyltransferase family 87 protein [Singulisphaera sp. GP187]SIO56386.1 Protein of unknown function [Singulisphaera sp. GP187]
MMGIGREGRNSALAIVSATLVLVAYAAIFDLLDRYDWDQAFVRFACLASLLAMTLGTRRRPDMPPHEAGEIAAIVAPAFAILALNWGLYKSLEDLHSPPVVDIGQTTQEAARLVFLDGKNPYESRTIAVLGDNPSMWGFKYGPTMILGYAISVVNPANGIKSTSLAYLGATVVLVFLLGRGRGEMSESTATAWFCCTLMLLPNRLWHELFHQGSNDIFPVMLILGSILAVRGKAWAWAGLLAGLSLTAKVSPAIFYLVLFVRRRPEPRFVVGFAAGLVPLLPFLAWDAGALFRNVVLFHSTKAADSTSLYSITPKELHYAFTAIQLMTIALVIAKNFHARLDHRSLVFWYLVLTLLCEMSYREVHGNHLIWFMPFAALQFGWNRQAFLPNIASALRSFGDESPAPAPRADHAASRPEGRASNRQSAEGDRPLENFDDQRLPAGSGEPSGRDGNTSNTLL